MRFSAIAVSVAIFGVAMAVPSSVVYETEVVTITSCAPEKTNCPGRLHSSSSAVTTSAVPPVPTVAPVYSSSSTTIYQNGTTPVSAPPVVKPTAATGTAKTSVTVPLSTGYSWAPSASAGVPYPPANTSAPAVPTSPSQPFEGAASIKGFSFAALAVAAAALVLA